MRTSNLLCLIAFFSVTLGGCALPPRHHPNVPTATVNEIGRLNNSDRTRSDKLFVFLAFSGGGARASSLSYGVLEELSETVIIVDGEKRRLIDEVDVISSVSGGSVTAAYYGLYGDRIFEDFEQRFLKRDISADLTQQYFKPWNWVRLASPEFDRTDLTTEFLERTLFKDLTFSDIDARGGPTIIINATNMNNGTRFAFDRTHFDWICSDLGNFSVARAVTTSAAVPVILAPTTLKNYAGDCDFQPSVELTGQYVSEHHNGRSKHEVSVMNSYLDREAQPYIHLFDGSLSDNLGVRSAIDAVSHAGSTKSLIQRSELANTQKALFIIVNAQRASERRWGKKAQSPSLTAVVMAATRAPVSAYAFETVMLLRSKLKQWQNDFAEFHCDSNGRKKETCDSFDSYIVEIDFDQIEDSETREYLHQIQTSVSIDPEDVDLLRTNARHLLLNSQEYQAFIDR